MIDYLLLLLCVVAVMSGRTAAIAFALFSVIHDQLFWSLPGWGYYLSAGAFDVIALAAIAILARPSRLATSLICICILSLFLNFYGWVIWFGYLSPVSYNVSFLVLYSITILVILRGDAAKNERVCSFRVFPSAQHKSINIC